MLYIEILQANLLPCLLGLLKLTKRKRPTRRSSILTARFFSSQFLSRKNSMSGGDHMQPLVIFGVLTDIQYADCDDRPAGYDPGKIRYYRKALNHIDKAFNAWKGSSQPVSFALQLGDIIDGLNVKIGNSDTALKQTLQKFEFHHSIPTFHTVGNHELYNFKRDALAFHFNESVEKMNIPPEVFRIQMQTAENQLSSPILYYKFCPNPALKFISLDCFDISVLGHDTRHPAYQKAADILQSYHKHSIYELWDSDGPLKGLDTRFQQMNGAVGKDQLQWLEEELEDSDKKGQKVVIFGHVSLSPDSTDPSCLLWNYDEVLDCFHKHHCVVAYLSGHTHVKGYAVDTHGIHYIAFTGIIETPPEEASFATISLYADKMEVVGHGLEDSYSLKFPIHPLMDENEASEKEAVIHSSISVKVEV